MRYGLIVIGIAGLMMGLGGCDHSTGSDANGKLSSSMRSSQVKAAGSASRPRANKNSIVAKAKAEDAGVSERNAEVPARKLCEGNNLNRPFPTQPLERGQAADEPVLRSAIRTGRGRWVWVNLWAAWCVPCKQELPLLFEWKRRLASDVDFAFVSLDDDERQFHRFLQSQPPGGLRASYWLAEGKSRAAWLKAAGLELTPELPVQILVNPRGKIHCIIRGAMEPSDLYAMRTVMNLR